MITSVHRAAVEKRLAEIDKVIRTATPPIMLREGDVFRALTIELKATVRGLLDAAPVHVPAPEPEHHE